MSTEETDPRFAELDLWATRDAVSAMFEGQLAAAGAVRPQIDAIAKAAEDAATRLGGSNGRLIYVGAGTSGRLAVLDGVELGPTFDWGGERISYLLAGGGDAMLSSVEGAEDDGQSGGAAMRRLDPNPSDVVVGVAASGRTPYTVAAVEAARAMGALTIGIASNAGSPLLETADYPILLDTGAEIIAGSTRMKAGTAQKIALNLFSTAVMLRLGRVYGSHMVSMRLSNRKLRARAVQLVCDVAGVERPVAEDALARAGDDIKRAVLISLGISPEQSAASLDAAGGNLRTALDQTRRE